MLKWHHCTDLKVSLLHIQNHLGDKPCLWLSQHSKRAVLPSLISVENVIYPCHTDTVHLNTTLHHTDTKFCTLLLQYFSFACIPLIECEYRIIHTQQTLFWGLCSAPYDIAEGLRILHLSTYTLKQEVYIKQQPYSTGNCKWQWIFVAKLFPNHYDMAGFTLWSLKSSPGFTSTYFSCFIELHVTVCTQCLQTLTIVTEVKFATQQYNSII
jgi:hypothetical protein